MKQTADESAVLKQAFKAHFRSQGYLAPLPDDLAQEAKLFPLEWAEACQEWEEANG